MTGLGYFPGTNGQYGGAGPVSGNGMVIGGSSSGNDGTQPFLWSAATGMVNIDTLQHAGAEVYNLNYDGSLAVGMVIYDGIRRAYRWGTNGGMQLLGIIAGTTPDRIDSWGYDLSQNGSVVVGTSYKGPAIVPFRWTAATGTVQLPLLAGATLGDAYGISANGSIIVGHQIAGNIDHATRWDQSLRVESIENILMAHGYASVLGGSSLVTATGISADGETIVGWGYGPNGQFQGWVATIPVPEPSTWLSGLFGAFLLAVYCHFRRAAHA